MFHRLSKITVTVGRAAAFSNFFELSVDIMTCIELACSRFRDNRVLEIEKASNMKIKREETTAPFSSASSALSYGLEQASIE